MIVYPKYSTRRSYLGEIRLRQLLEGLELDGAFAIHSVNLPEHEYKRWGEIDFLVVSPLGLSAIEVKGGTVEFVDRVWRYSNGRGQSIESTESPAAQSQSATRALERQISKQLGLDVGCSWGVAFPLTDFRRNLAELPRVRLADLPICRDAKAFEDWLIGIFRAERGVTPLDEETMEALREYLVPKFSATTSAGLAIGLVASRVIELTRQQMDILDGLHDNPRLLVTGGAGTGKTELAVLAAKSEALEGRATAMLTMEKSLVPWFSRALAGTEVDVVEGFPAKIYDTLVVDEAQDYAFPESTSRLFASVKGGLAYGRWRWFMDPNRQFFERPPDLGCVEILQKSAAGFRLSRNVRTTREIVELVQAILRADVGVSEIDGFGIPVRFSQATQSSGASIAANELGRLLDGEVEPRQIAILGPRGADGAVGSALLREYHHRVEVFDRRTDPLRRTKASIASIRDFRGLEAAACILVDLDELPAGPLGNSLLYVAMTRASASLTFILTGDASRRLSRIAIEAAMRSEVK